MESVHPVAVTLETFQVEVVAATVPVVIDFWAPWCGPCRQIAPVLDRLAGEFAGRVKVVKVNVDEQQALASKFPIRGIPTLEVFVKGASVGQVVGWRGPKPLEELFEKLASLPQEAAS